MESKKGGSKCRLFLLVGAKVLLAVIIPAVVDSYQAAEVADKAVERRVVAQTSRVPYTRRRKLQEQTSGASRAFYVVQMERQCWTFSPAYFVEIDPDQANQRLGGAANNAHVSAMLPCMQFLPTTRADAPRCRTRFLPSHRREASLSTDATSPPPQPSKGHGWRAHVLRVVCIAEFAN